MQFTIITEVRYENGVLQYKTVTVSGIEILPDSGWLPYVE